MNIAVIDLGTNTFNLLIAEIKDNTFKTLHITKEFVKLGEGGINERMIQKMPFKRGVDTLMDYKLIAQQYNCKEIIAIATSAIRNAQNGDEFIQTVKNLISEYQFSFLLEKGTVNAPPSKLKTPLEFQKNPFLRFAF